MITALPHRNRQMPMVQQFPILPGGPHRGGMPAAQELRSPLRGRVPVPLERLAGTRLQHPAASRGDDAPVRSAPRAAAFPLHDMQVAVTIPL